MPTRRTIATLTGGLAGLGLACCLTPLLPVVLGGIGASWLVPILYRDALLLPFSALMLIVTGGLLWSMRR